MRITVTARHCEVSDALRTRARAELTRLARVASRPHDGRVLFTTDHRAAVVELRLHTARGVVHVARGEGSDHRTALDRASARVRRQLEKTATARRRLAGRRAP